MEERNQNNPQELLPKYQYQQQGYTYRNPHPTQMTNYELLKDMIENGEPTFKRKHPGLVISISIAGAVLVLCALVAAVAVFFGENRVEKLEESWFGSSFFAPQEEQDKPSSQEESKDQPVYSVPDMTMGQKEGEALSLVEINKKVSGSVVAILISENGQPADFSGSGFIISEDGYIITNEHVISGAREIKVVLSGQEKEYAAALVGADERSDLAVLKIDAAGLAPVELGDSSLLEVGESVVAIGNPYGMELAGTVTNGIVSALNRKIEIGGSYMTLIQTNASINPGNSGGPLVNSYGQVVGITSSKLVASGYEGIGFAIPIDHAVEIAEELITHGKVITRAYIGISGGDITVAEAAQYNMPQGVYVAEVDPTCDAAAKGLKTGDILVGFNGEKITTMAELNEKKDQFKPGDKVSLTYWRNKKETTIEIQLREASND